MARKSRRLLCTTAGSSSDVNGKNALLDETLRLLSPSNGVPCVLREVGSAMTKDEPKRGNCGFGNKAPAQGTCITLLIQASSPEAVLLSQRPGWLGAEQSALLQCRLALWFIHTCRVHAQNTIRRRDGCMSTCMCTCIYIYIYWRLRWPVYCFQAGQVWKLFIDLQKILINTQKLFINMQKLLVNTQTLFLRM